MESYSRIKKGVVLSQVTLVANTAVGIIYTPIMLRMIGQSEYGLYTLVISTANYLNLLNLGFTSSYLRFYCRFRADEKEHHRVAELNGMYMYIFTLMGLVALLIGFGLVFSMDALFAESLNEAELKKATIMMALMVMNLGLKFPMSVFNTYIAANERYVFLKSVNLVKTLIYPFIVIGVLSLGYKSMAMLLIMIASTVIVELINWYFCIAKLKMRFNFRVFDFSLIKELTAFSSFVFINMIVSQINLNVDKFLLGKFLGTVSVAVYGVASKLNVYYLSISLSVSSVLTPRVNHLVARKEPMKNVTALITKVGRLQMLILIYLGIGYVVFGKAFIGMWAGDGYEDAYYVLLLLMIALLIPSTQNLAFEVQKAQNKLKVRSLLQLFMAFLNVGISIPLIKAYGPIGAAVGTSIATIIVDVLVMNVYYHRRVHLDMLHFWKENAKLIPGFILPVASGMGISRFADLTSEVSFVGYALGFSLIYGVSVYFLAMNRYEKQLLHKPIKKILLKLQG